MRDVLLKRQTRSGPPRVVASVQRLESRVVLSATATSTTLAASSLAIIQGRRLTLTARVDAAQAGAINQGFVTFTDGPAVVGVAEVRDNVARIDLGSLTVGTHRFSAAYGGGGDFLPSRVAIDGSEEIRTFAGGRADGYSGDGGPATSAQLYTPADVAFDRAGNAYIADMGNQAIRRVTPDGIITTVAGTGVSGNSGDGGPATSARLNYPFGVVVDPSGNIFIADTINNSIRKVTPDGIISRFPGYGPLGTPSEGGRSTLSAPQNLAFDAAGDLYIADPGNEVVRKVTPDGVASIIAGTGTRGYTGDGGSATAARLGSPFGVALDAAGNLYIAERVNHAIRRVTPEGVITTVAGTGVAGYSGDGGPATSARLYSPFGVAVDAAGNLFIADGANNVIRRVTPAGVISTVAGSGTQGYAGNGGPATDARLNFPLDMAFDAAGNLYIADSGNFAIRQVVATTDVVVAPAPVGFTITVAPGVVTAGVPTSVAITAFDAAGNPVPQFTGTVRLSTSDTRATLPDEVVLSGGQASVPVTFRTALPALIVARSTDDPGVSGRNGEIQVNPGATTRFAVTVDPVVEGTVGLARVTALDDFGNITPDYSGTIRLTTSDGLAAAPPARFEGGSRGFVVSLGSTGSKSVVATDFANPGLTGTSPAIFVTPMVRGRVFRDSDADGVFGPGDVGLAGRVVIVDWDGNGQDTPGEPRTVTSPDGTFAFPGTAQGRAPVVELGDRAASLRNIVGQTRTRADGSVEVGVVPFSPLAPITVVPGPLAAGPAPDPDDAYVRSLYRAVLGRDGSDVEVGMWLDSMDRGLTRGDVAWGFVNSPEHRIRQVGAMYRALLHRELDPLAQHWADALRAGASEQDVVAGIVNSAEYQAARPDDDALVGDLTRDILGRDPDPVGLADRRAALASGSSRATVVAALVDSAEAADQAIAGLYAAYFRRATDPGSASWSNALRARRGSASAIAARLLSSDEFYDLASRGTA